MTTIGNFLSKSEKRFVDSDIYFGHGTDNPWDEAVAIVLHVLKLPPDVDKSIESRVLTTYELESLENIVDTRIKTKKPLAYILGVAWYAFEKYIVTEDVLIPRSPIAFVVETMLPDLYEKNDKIRILDLCTGSGCIGIHAAKVFKNAQVDLVDISKKALNVANQNIQLHRVSDRVKTIQSDLFKNVSLTYDIILTNPPYVGDAEMSSLPAEYKHEPELALSSGIDGLKDPVAILEQAHKFLKEDGVLILEVGNTCDLLDEKYPSINLNWLELEHGGDGVCLLTYKDLKDFG